MTSNIMHWLSLSACSIAMCTAPLICTTVARANDAPCKTTIECANSMVKLANDLKEQNTQLVKRIKLLEDKITEQEVMIEKIKLDGRAYSDKSLTDFANVLSASGTDSIPTPGGNSQSASCPKGSFLVAVRYQIDAGGPHGITSWLFPVCRTLK